MACNLKKRYPLYLSNEQLFTNNLPSIAVQNKYSLKNVTEVSSADANTISKAISLGSKAEKAFRKMATYERKTALQQIILQLRERHEELAQVLCIEAGKPIKDSRGEVTRCIETFEIAAEESTRIYGEYTPFDISEANKGYWGIQRRFLIGLVSMISPFNFPLNLVAHKIAPAIAVGCPFILKPSSLTPIGALILGEIMSKTNLPKGAFSILPSDTENASDLVTDQRIKMLTFTGSPKVGWSLKAKCGKKKIVLELGGNASCVVDESADLVDVTERVIFGAFYQSGQSCISVQRLFVHEKIYDKFAKLLVQKTISLKSGDPSDEKTFIGPVISVKEAIRCKKWIDQSLQNGAKILCGGKIYKNIVQPTIIEDVAKDCELWKEEVFGPIVCIQKFTSFKKTIDSINESKYGLQSGVFTNDMNKAFYAYENIETGGVVINDVPSKRIDSMPYGGVKDSGIGKEGVRDSIMEMTNVRLMLARNIGIM